MRPSLFRHLVARGIQVRNRSRSPATLSHTVASCGSHVRNFPKFQVHLFVCNEERDMETALTLGATGVMSDYPTRLTDYLSQLPGQDS